MSKQHLLAFDLGAESGRAILGTLAGGRLQLKELCRFPNAPVELLGHLHWDILRLLGGVKDGLRICASEEGVEPLGIGVDTWGVDYGLLASDGSLLGLPYAYRDSRTDGAIDEFFERVPRERVYGLTGIQVMPINTLFQLYAMVRDRSPLLGVATDLLFTPDLINYLLTGEKTAEFTIASTSQLYNPVAATWAAELFDALGISAGIMQEIVQPGTIIGALEGAVRRETGVGEVPVIATTGHDTAAAVAATPAEGSDWAYISSGTWSLMGVETAAPIITDESREGNFTNEGGVGGTFRVLKNIMGLWLLQQCRRSWGRERRYEYEELVHMAEGVAPFAALVEPDHLSFLHPPDMPGAIREFCLRTEQPPPEDPAAFTRCILESLALKYRFALDQLRRIHAGPINRIHIIGGGARNELLSQFAANATGLPVIAGPVEATAAGNLLVQASALGHIPSLAAIREVVRRSFGVKTYEPQETDAWDAAYERFRDVHRRSEEL